MNTILFAKGLFELGIVDKDLEEKLIQMAGYRNRLVHMYHLVIRRYIK